MTIKHLPLKYFKLLIYIIILLSTNNLFGFSNYGGVFHGGIEGSQLIIDNTLLDTNPPFSHFNENDLIISLYQSYFKIDRLQHETSGEGADVYGDDLKGKSMTTTLVYALTSDFAFFGNYNYLTYTGNAIDKIENAHFSIDLTLHHFDTGFIYELYEGETLSLPFTLGYGYRKWYNEVYYYDNNNNIHVNYIVDDTVYVVKVGLAASFKIFDSFIISPFFLFHFMESIIATQYQNNVKTEVGEAGSSSPLPGLSIKYITGSGLSFSIGFSGFASNFDPYSEMFLDGQRLKSFNFGIFYTF